MRRLIALLASGYLLGGCSKPASQTSNFDIYTDTTHHVVCYDRTDADAAIACVYVPPAPPAEPDGTYHVPPVPGDYSHDRINRA